MSILCTPDDVVEENKSPEPGGEDVVYLSVEVAITPDEAAELVDTLPSNNSTARAARDPLSRAVLEAIKDSGILGG
jgi:hypothetical protein